MNLQRSRDKWKEWSTEKIRSFLLQNRYIPSLGKRSNRKIKKIRFLQNILDDRQKVERLLIQ